MIKSFFLLLGKEWHLMMIKSAQTLILFSFLVISCFIYGLALRYVQFDDKVSIALIWILLFFRGSFDLSNLGGQMENLKFYCGF